MLRDRDPVFIYYFNPCCWEDDCLADYLMMCTNISCYCSNKELLCIARDPATLMSYLVKGVTR